VLGRKISPPVGGEKSFWRGGVFCGPLVRRVLCFSSCKNLVKNFSKNLECTFLAIGNWGLQIFAKWALGIHMDTDFGHM
jgi:hypothetical protein